MIFSVNHLTHFRGSWFRLFPTLITAVLVAACSACSREKMEATEILWDTWRVPHVFASNEKELFHAFGWAQMASHGDLILRLYGEARGRAAEYWGPENLDLDRWVRTMGIPARAHEWTKAQEPEFRAYLDAFAAGMNAYAREHADRISPEVQVVLPVIGADILAHFQRVIHFTFVAGPQVVTAAKGSGPERAGRMPGPSLPAGRKAETLCSSPIHICPGPACSSSTRRNSSLPTWIPTEPPWWDFRGWPSPSTTTWDGPTR